MNLYRTFSVALLLISFHSFGQVINTIGGNGTSVCGGNGGQLVDATFEAPTAITFDPAGNMYISDGARVRKVATNGIITAIAGTGVAGYSGDGGPATMAEINTPWGLAVDAAGNVYISEYSNGRIRKVAAGTGIITTYGGGGTGLNEGGAATGAAISYPWGITLDASGNLYICCVGQNMVRRISTTGIITTVAGTGGWNYNGDNIPANTANIATPRVIAIDGAGNLYVTDDNTRVRKIATNGIITTLVMGYGGGSFSVPLLSGGVANPMGIAVNSAGTKLYMLDGNYIVKVADVTANAIWRYCGLNNTDGFSGDGGYADLAAIDASHIALDATGALYIADGGNHRIRKVTNNCPRPMAAGMITSMEVSCDEFDFSINPVNGATSYLWTLPPGWTGATNSIAITAIHSFYAPSNGVVSVSAVNNCGPGPLVEIAGVYHPDLTVTPNGPTTYCTNEQIVTLNGVPGQGVGNYHWLLNGVEIPGATDPQYTPTQSGAYSLKIDQWLSTCSDTSQSVNVTINQAPNLQLTFNTPWPFELCDGDQLIMTAATGTGYTYQWIENWSTIIPGATSNSYTATTSGNYGVIISSGACVDTGGTNAIFNPLPNTITYNNGPDNLCDGTPELTNSSYTLNYQWQLNGVNIPNAYNSSYDATLPGTYTTLVTNTNTGCSAISAPYVITQTPIPVNIVANGPITFCESTVTLLADDSSNYDYQWQMNGVDINGAINSTYGASASGDYRVVVMQSNISACTVTSNVITVTEWPLPSPVITQNGNQLSVPAMFNTYQWYYNNSQIPGANSNVYIATADGDYQVSVHDSCWGQSNTVTVSGTLVRTAGRQELSIYPNPTYDDAQLSINNLLSREHTLILYNTHGQECRKYKFSSDKLLIEKGSLPSGIYHFQLWDEAGKLATGKLTIL